MSSSEILLYKLRVIGDKTENIYKNIKYNCCPEKHKQNTAKDVLEIENIINNNDKELKQSVLDISNTINEENNRLSYLLKKLELLEKT